MSEAQKIHKYIIKSTPYGELSQVLKDINRISPIDLSSSGLLSTIQNYNEDHLAIINGSEKPFVLMSNNKISEGQYIDQTQSKTYWVDHVKQQIIKSEEYQSQMIPQVKDLLIHLKNDVQSYVSQYYRIPNGIQVFSEVSAEGLTIHIGLTSKNISIAKYYTGQWISKWQVTKESIEGIINIRAHFFEGGNVQFNQKKKFKQNFQFTEDMAQNSKQITKIIKEFEDEVQKSLNTIYQEMPDKFFKKLRRLAPYTKSKMVWNLNSIKMNHNILQGKNK